MTKIIYRNYYLKGNDTPTNFEKESDNEWLCTHGSWVGYVEGGDELTLHHDYGKVTYDRYEEYCVEREESGIGKIDGKYYGLDDWMDDVPF